MRSVTTNPPTTFAEPRTTAANPTTHMNALLCGCARTIIAPTTTMPTHASQLLSRNVAALLGVLVSDGELSLDWDDEIVAATCVTRKEVAA